ncbi:hypothetical protein AB0N99_30575 [Streptomyces sp. NPDC093272]|uniref:hypothetical protein n=1 Tax=Streptomyces sp. NPDC093272 TaxID=3154981 RepID=UPI00342B5985
MANGRSPERSGRYRWPRDVAEAQGRHEPANRGLPAAGAVRGLTLLPTPTASNPNDGESLESWEARRQRNLAKGINGNGQGTPLSIAVRLATIGPERWVTPDGVDYGPAVRRWESILDRPAPEPTERTKGGGRGLSARFVEWMQGAPKGWITDIDIPRAQQIKIGGNGAMTRQAVEGYRRLLCADLDAMAA